MIHYFAAGVAATRKALERECPTCHYRQVVAASKRDEEVPCEKCGAPVPRKPEQA